MKKDYTILIPNMLPVHFELAKGVLCMYGYKVVLLKNEGRQVIDKGLKYVHNDTCYPALLCIGQMIDALQSGAYDLSRTALMITQTGGGCRASNYIHLLRKALQKAGYADVPVISLSLGNMEKNSGFRLTLPMMAKIAYALLYGDLLMLLKNQVSPYEVNKGDSQALTERWTDALMGEIRSIGALTRPRFQKNAAAIVEDFARVPVRTQEKVKVGVVGEIYVKYSDLANNHLVEFLESQGCEAMVPGVLGFFEYMLDNNIMDIELYGGSRAKRALYKRMLRYVETIENRMIAQVASVGRFTPPSPHRHTREKTRGLIGRGCKMGEGWLLTAEMAELIERGYENVICAQPFGCLPNHIVGKGMIRKLMEKYPRANVVPIDYDPGATKVNQENRIKLMLAVARDANG